MKRSLLIFSLGASLALVPFIGSSQPSDLNSNAQASGLAQRESVVDMSKPLAKARELAGKNLRYLWGGHEVEKGGLDCSGFIYRVFKDSLGVEMPQTASTQYRYIQDHGLTFPVRWTADGRHDITGVQPGDLLFWQNTRPMDRKPPVGHVMMFIGTSDDGKYLMAGAQNNGVYKGQAVHGVNIYELDPDKPVGGIKDKEGNYLIRGDLLAWGRLTKLE